MAHLRTKGLNEGARTLRIPGACQRYNLGSGTMRKVAEDAGAIIRIGRCVLIDCEKVDSYLSAKAGKG